MGANPHANGGTLLRDLRVPDFRAYGVDVPRPGAVEAEDTAVLSGYIRDLMTRNLEAANFRLFAPDEAASNRLSPIFQATGRRWEDPIDPRVDQDLSPSGRVMDAALSEHLCQGWLEGYLLTGRHGLLCSYEAFIRTVDSMVAQHAKWLKVARQLPWRPSIASLNYLLSSHVWQQDHNGFTHQDPGFLDHVGQQEGGRGAGSTCPRTPTACSAVSTTASRAGTTSTSSWPPSSPGPSGSVMDEAIKHCTHGIGIWQWASNDQGHEPDVVMACCGDTPTLETLAAVTILRRYLPELKIRVINVVDLMKLQPHTEHPHGLTDEDYDALFTTEAPIIFAFHGYPTLVHELTYRRHNKKLHVRGYKEEGTITTPLRHAGAQRYRPVPPGHGHGEAPAPAGQQRLLPDPGDEGQAGGAPAVYQHLRPGPARGPGLALGDRPVRRGAPLDDSGTPVRSAAVASATPFGKRFGKGRALPAFSALLPTCAAGGKSV